MAIICDNSHQRAYSICVDSISQSRRFTNTTNIGTGWVFLKYLHRNADTAKLHLKSFMTRTASRTRPTVMTSRAAIKIHISQIRWNKKRRLGKLCRILDRSGLCYKFRTFEILTAQKTRHFSKDVDWVTCFSWNGDRITVTPVTAREEIALDLIRLDNIFSFGVRQANEEPM